MHATTVPGAIARLGYVLNWLGMAAGVIIGGFGAFAVGPLGPGWQLIFGSAAFLVCYAAGRACRYILAGR
jgi:hypothetical protein